MSSRLEVTNSTMSIQKSTSMYPLLVIPRKYPWDFFYSGEFQKVALHWSF